MSKMSQMNNMLQVKIFRLSFPEVKLHMRDSHKLRGYIASLFPENDEFHNHGEKGWLYRYPVVQYKVLEGIPYIVGIKKGAEELLRVEDEIEELVLKNYEIPLYEKALMVGCEPYGVLDDVIEYDFITPWMALNQSNYRRYEAASGLEKREILRSVLIGNLLSMSKGLGHQVDKKIIVDIGNIKSIETKFKDKTMLAFKGSFIVNFAIPDYLGLGKSVSRGFGTVCRCR